MVDRLLSSMPAQTPGAATETPGLDAPLQGRVHGGERGKGLGVTGQRKDWLLQASVKDAAIREQEQRW